MSAHHGALHFCALTGTIEYQCESNGTAVHQHAPNGNRVSQSQLCVDDGHCPQDYRVSAGLQRRRFAVRCRPAPARMGVGPHGLNVAPITRRLW